MPEYAELLKLKLDLIYRGKSRSEIKELFEELTKTNATAPPVEEE